MTADQRFVLLLSGLTLIFMIISAILGVVWRAAINQSRLTTQVQALIESVKDIAKDVDEHLRWHLDSAGRRR
jgi:hypothetical protein